MENGSEQPWCTYALHLATPMHSLITDPLLFYLLHLSTASNDATPRCRSFFTLALWMLLVKVAKLLPHYYRYPRDVWFLPMTIIFGYLHGIIKYYALLTLTEVYVLLVIEVIKLIRVRHLGGVARIGVLVQTVANIGPAEWTCW